MRLCIKVACVGELGLNLLRSSFYIIYVGRTDLLPSSLVARLCHLTVNSYYEFPTTRTGLKSFVRHNAIHNTQLLGIPRIHASNTTRVLRFKIQEQGVKSRRTAYSTQHSGLLHTAGVFRRARQFLSLGKVIRGNLVF